MLKTEVFESRQGWVLNAGVRLCKWLKVTGNSITSQGVIKECTNQWGRGSILYKQKQLGKIDKSHLKITLQQIEIPPSTSHSEFLWTQIVKVSHAGCASHQRGWVLHHALGTWSQTAIFLQQTCARVKAGPSPHHSKARHQTTLWAAQRGLCQHPSSKALSSPPLALQVSERREISPRR